MTKMVGYETLSAESVLEELKTSATGLSTSESQARQKSLDLTKSKKPRKRRLRKFFCLSSIIFWYGYC